MYSDFHNDFLTAENARSILASYEKNKLRIVGAIFRGKRSFDEVYKITKDFKAQKPQFCDFAFEDIGFSLEEVEILAREKPLYATLTWNGENSLGYGCDFNLGLKARGSEAIGILNEFGVAVDTAHISQKGFFDIIDRADKVVNSHTCFTSVCAHKRNITSEQVKCIVERGGLIGLAFYSPFVTENENCNELDVFKQIDYFCSRFGYKNLALGTDFYGAEEFPNGLKSYSDMKKLENLMREQGYPEVAVRSIMFDNLNDFMSVNKTS